MLAISYKRTELVDLVKPLKGHIHSAHNKKTANRHVEALAALNDLRGELKARMDNNDTSDATLDILYKYYGQVLVIGSRFPIGRAGVRVGFCWYDCLKPKSKSTLESIWLEKASVAFNLGSWYSVLGRGQDRTTKDGLKVAKNAFQRSAGAFQAVKEVIGIHPLEHPTVDTTSDFVDMLLNTMRAQAMDCVYENTMIDRKMGPALVCKIAWQTALFYEKAKQAATRVKPLVGDKTWLWPTHLDMMYRLFAARAQAQKALAEEAAKPPRWGHQVARMRLADSAAKTVLELFKVLPNAEGKIAREMAALSAKRASSEKDNDTIYHEHIPGNEDLEALSAGDKISALAKTLELDDPSKRPDFEDNFSDLIPAEHIAAFEQYKESREAVVKAQEARVVDADEVLNGLFREMSLPLPEGAQGNQLPQRVQSKVDAVRNSGGEAAIQATMRAIQEQGMRDSALLDTIGKMIEDEEAEDGALRQQWGSKWSRHPSHIANDSLAQEITGYRNKLLQAGKSDQIVHGDLARYADILSKISGPQEALLVSLGPPEEPSVVDKTLVRTLNALASEAITLKEKWSDKVAEMKRVASEESVQAVLGGGEDTPEKAAENALARFRGYAEQMSKIFDTLPPLVERIKSTHAQYKSGRGSKGSARDVNVRNVETGCDIFDKLQRDLEQGLKFYRGLEDHLLLLKQKVGDFCFARTTEKDELLREINRKPLLPFGRKGTSPNLRASGAAAASGGRGMSRQFSMPVPHAGSGPSAGVYPTSPFYAPDIRGAGAAGGAAGGAAAGGPPPGASQFPSGGWQQGGLGVNPAYQPGGQPPAGPPNPYSGGGFYTQGQQAGYPQGGFGAPPGAPPGGYPPGYPGPGGYPPGGYPPAGGAPPGAGGGYGGYPPPGNGR